MLVVGAAVVDDWLTVWLLVEELLLAEELLPDEVELLLEYETVELLLA